MNLDTNQYLLLLLIPYLLLDNLPTLLREPHLDQILVEALFTNLVTVTIHNFLVIETPPLQRRLTWIFGILNG